MTRRQTLETGRAQRLTVVQMMVQMMVTVTLGRRTAASTVRNRQNDSDQNGGQNYANDERDETVRWCDDGFEEQRIIDRILARITVMDKDDKFI